jgi:hypothetical protein
LLLPVRLKLVDYLEVPVNSHGPDGRATSTTCGVAWCEHVAGGYVFTRSHVIGGPPLRLLLVAAVPVLFLSQVRR